MPKMIARTASRPRPMFVGICALLAFILVPYSALGQVRHKTTPAEGIFIDNLQARIDGLSKQGNSRAELGLNVQLLTYQEKIYGATDDRLVETLWKIGIISFRLNDLIGAEKALRRAYRIDVSRPAEGNRNLFFSQRNLAIFLTKVGKLKEAEPLFRKAADYSGDYINDFDFELAELTIGFAENLHGQGRLAEAINWYRQAQNIYSDEIHRPGTRLQGKLGEIQEAIGGLLFEMGRITEAEPYYLEAYFNSRVDNDDSDCQPYQAQVLSRYAIRFGRSDLAPYAEELLRCEFHVQSWRQNFNLAENLKFQGRNADALGYFKRALQLQERNSGSPNPDVAMISEPIAWLQLDAGQVQAAAASARAALVIRNALALREVARGDAQSERQFASSKQLSATLLVESLLATQPAGNQPNASVAEAFLAAQAAGGGDDGGSMLKGAARTSLDLKGQELAKRWEDKLQERSAVERMYSSQSVDGTSTDEALANLQRQRLALNAEVKAIEEQLRASYKAYFDLIKPEPVTINDLQAMGSRPLLGSDEALILLSPGMVEMPKAFRRGYVFVVTRETVAWAQLGMAPDELRAAIMILRSHLDGSSKTYDRKTAKKIYDALFGVGPVATALAGKQNWIISPQGDLLSLPFSPLVAGDVTGDDSNPESLRRTPWLGIAKAISILPDISSLIAVRNAARSQDNARTEFFGVGDPNFKRGMEDPRNLAIASSSSANAPSADQKLPPIMTAEVRNILEERLTKQVEVFYRRRPDLLRVPKPDRRPSGNEVAKLTHPAEPRGSQAPSDTIAQIYTLPRLSQTEGEVKNAASLLKAASNSTLFGDQATEANLFVSNVDGRLGRSRVVMLATHGLLNGELQGLTEAALVLAPGVMADAVHGEQNDGLLTASEAAKLKLSADWVILSACNTAVGGPNASGLNGLARSFFYAGADALLLSQWEVIDGVAMRLTTQTITLRRSDPTISRAEALRRAMQLVINDDTMDNTTLPFADPKVWAPIEIVGINR